MMYDEGRDLELPEGVSIVDYMKALTEELEQRLLREGIQPPKGLWVTIHDDRERAINEGKRQLQSGAAECSQMMVRAADELMRMAGNGVWNSPNGYDRVAREVIMDTRTKLLRIFDYLDRLERTLVAFEERGGWVEMQLRDRIAREQRAAAIEAKRRERSST